VTIIDNESCVDKYSALHIVTGVIFGILNFPLWFVLILAIVFELIENPLKVKVDLFPSQKKESLRNQVFDVIFVVLGWGIGIAINIMIFGM